MRNFFNTPILSSILRLLARCALFVCGWRVCGETPAHKKYILIGAPHTSNWDFPLMLCTILVKHMNVQWMGKHTLFKAPFHGLMCWLGGVPIERSQTHNTVEQMATIFNQSQELALIITPEGTRSKVGSWKSGFYHIAVAAKIPIVFGFLDTTSKTCGFGPSFIPSGDYDSDLIKIQAFYADKTGIRPANA